MTLTELVDRLGTTKSFKARLTDGLALVSNATNGSEYIVEKFDNSFQIRQAISFQCSDEFGEDIILLYDACSKVNERFSGCKNCIDQSDVLITICDIISGSEDHSYIEGMLNQVEFMSQAMVTVVNLIRSEGRSVTENELDEILYSPTTQ